ncbi:MAG: hypothetical protein MUP47_05555 [Phycisphaerae bacterium]|nr:hypothetical protein [Phycisphaerae bacterium]
MMPGQVNRKAAFACILALILLAIMAALGAALAAGSCLGVVQSANQASIQCSLLQSESGLSYLMYTLRDVTLPAEVTGQDLLNALAAALQTRLNGTPNLAGAQVTVLGSTISIPSITTDQGYFRATISLAADNVFNLTVAGSDGKTTRSVGMSINAEGGSSSIFEYGVASRSAVSLTGNASVYGANDPNEAKILSTTYTNLEAFRLTGNCHIDGDIYSANPDSYATITGNVVVGEASGSAIQDHIHIGVGDVDFPEADPTIFEPFATNIVDANTPTGGNRTFTNIRIKANTNPNFSGNTTIRGVVFVEAPNEVRFTGNLNLTGVIVTEDAGDNVYTTNTIRFTGNTAFQGVENLPNTPEFAQVRLMPGTSLLAPGFGVTFTGNFGSVGGCMAADAFTWTGNASGTIHGSIINYGDSAFTLTGNSRITIDRSGSPQIPPGFAIPRRLSPVASSYREY